MVCIFVSSTSRDLADHRAAVIDVLIRANHQPIAMETFGSKAGDARGVSLQEVQKADLFIGIYARRYGYRPDDDKSVTELEYIEAKQHNIDRLIFIVQDDYTHPLIDENSEKDAESIALLAGFKRRLLKENVRAEFTTPEDLAQQVLLAVQNWLADELERKSHQQPAPQPKYNIQNMNGGIIIDSISGGTQHFNNRNK